MISVVIPAYNNLEEVMCCLTSLQRTATGDVEYIVSDDSTDINLAEVIPESIARVVKPPYHCGFAPNCNYGASRASGDILFFVNQDIVALAEGGDWASGIREALHFKQIGMWAPMLLFPTMRIQSAGGFFDGRSQPCHFGINWENLESSRVATRRPVTWTTGAAFAIRMETFAQVDGFDIGYEGGYFEDVDLCLKVRSLGLEIAYDPFVKMIHKTGTSGGNPRFAKNAALFWEKWRGNELVKPETTSVYQGWW